MWCQFLLKNWGNKIEAKDLENLYLKSLDQFILAVQKGSENWEDL